MTLRGMVRISALGAILLAAITVASAVARGQTPQVSIETPTDTVVTPEGKRPLLFGFAKQVVDSAGLPQTAPRRSFCARARKQGDVVLVDSIVSRAEPELPACRPQDVPLVIRPTCELSFAEHVLYDVQRVRPVILFCGVPPVVYLIAKPGTL